jgi:hypothetical protein
MPYGVSGIGAGGCGPQRLDSGSFGRRFRWRVLVRDPGLCLAQTNLRQWCDEIQSPFPIIDIPFFDTLMQIGALHNNRVSCGLGG